MIVPLNNLNEDSRAILNWFGKDLEQVSIVIVIDQNPQSEINENQIKSDFQKTRQNETLQFQNFDSIPFHRKFQ